jgi:hypothetical protein
MPVLLMVVFIIYCKGTRRKSTDQPIHILKQSKKKSFLKKGSRLLQLPYIITLQQVFCLTLEDPLRLSLLHNECFLLYRRRFYNAVCLL